jgi:hypothetical protein
MFCFVMSGRSAWLMVATENVVINAITLGRRPIISMLWRGKQARGWVCMERLWKESGDCSRPMVQSMPVEVAAIAQGDDKWVKSPLYEPVTAL